MSRFHRQPRGFTLNELLIVMGIAILIIALAVPAFSYMTQSRSLESAENRISSYLQATRAEAIGLQQPRGVIFFEDSGTAQYTMAQVYYPPGQTPVGTAPYDINLIGGRDEVTLPLGVGLRGIFTSHTGSTSADPGTWKAHCVIMFDGDGRLLLDTYRIPAGTNALAQRMTLPAPAKHTLPLNNELANIGFILFDKNAFDSQPSASRSAFLKDNAVPYLVNRYAGSLMKAE